MSREGSASPNLMKNDETIIPARLDYLEESQVTAINA
jgi:hypothetical protein